MEVLTQYIEALLDLIYPPNINCILCNKYLGGEGEYGICRDCLQQLPFIDHHSCPRCAKPNRIDTNDATEGCSECSDMRYHFDKVIASVEYKGDIQRLVHKFKYSDATYLAKNMAEIMTVTLKKHRVSADIIIAVPLHPNKRRQRGYNQSNLLAKYINRNLGIHYGKKNLIRKKDTKIMHSLSKTERKQNVEDAFQVIKAYEILGKEVLLIDDVFTTGATVNSCSKELMKLGAKSVTVMAFARGI
ncbi:MAG: ComF family protein [Clostridiaceae bacterium]|nr:ComF family protein [Clostridiaceae bacterium]